MKKRITAAVISAVIAVQSMSVAFAWSSYSGTYMSDIIKRMSAEDCYGEIYSRVANEDLSQYSTDVTTEIEIPIGGNSIVIDGENIPITELDSINPEPAMLNNDKTMVPLRVLAGALDCELEWNGAEKSVSFTDAAGGIQTIYSGHGDENGIIKDDKFFVPLRLVSEKMGHEVGWKGNGAGGGVASVSALNDDAFQLKRLIVKLKSGSELENNTLKDILKYSAANTLFDEKTLTLYIFFNYETDTKNAYYQLNAEHNSRSQPVFRSVEPDKVYRSEYENMSIAEADTSWGIEYCGFDNFINTHELRGTVTVGVIDTGIYHNHPLFADRLVREEDISLTEDVHTGGGHGTHVAGIIAGATSGTGVKICPYVVCDSSGRCSCDSLFAAAFNAAKEQCDIINLSLSITGWNSSILEDTQGDGKLVVVAAGNYGVTVDNKNAGNAIAVNTDGIVVTAVDENGNPAGFSNRANINNGSDLYKSMIAAPGVRIVSASNNGSYYTASGTSQAAPHVTAAAALLMLYTGTKNAASIKNAVLSCVNKEKTISPEYGVGILDMSAYDRAEVTPVPTEKPSAAPTPGPTAEPTSEPTPEPTAKPTAEPATPAPATSGRYEWSETEISLKTGETKNVRLYYIRENYKDDVTSTSNIYSDDERIAKIDRTGKITAVGKGTTYIMFSQGGAASLSTSLSRIKVTVTETEIIGYEWSESSLDMNKGDTAHVTLYAVMSDGSKKDVTSSSSFYSSDENVAVISSDGTVTAKGAGAAQLLLQQGGTASLSARNTRITVNVTEEQSDYEISDCGTGVEITGYNGSERYLAVPNTISGKTVVKIGDSAFSKNKSLTGVSLPYSITEIGSSAFADCTNLKSIILPGSVESIGSYAFDSCSKLTDVSLPSGLDIISSYAFRGCTGIKNITVPDGVSEIKNSAFANCKSLNITIPDSVTRIDSNAFTKGNYIVIYADADSEAERYAKENGFTFYER